MKPFFPTILVLLIAIAVRADETLYRYEGDVHPLDPSAGWVMGNPCDPPCSEFLEDGHFVRFWSEADDFASYGFRITQPPDAPPPTLWVEWRFRSNFPLGPILVGCDAAFTVDYQGISDLVYMYGDSVITFEGGDFVLGLDMSQFHTFRFESLDGENYWWSVDGDRFVFSLTPGVPNGFNTLQMWGNGGCSIDWFPGMKNEWDFVRYGELDSGERIVATDPPSGFVSSGVLNGLDTFTVTFDAANYIYLDEITVTSTGGIAPTVIAVRRREIDEPDTVEIALDQPPPSGEITRFIFDDGEAVNIIEFADFQIGQAACCLDDGSCQDLTEASCDSLSGAVFRGGGTSCLGDNNNSGEDDACDDLFLIPAVSDWGVVALTLIILTAGTVLIRRPRTVLA
ncbi:MAG: hypothetical protein IH987_04010 [Planctomycetes bacterium]|nr:hypothetical protein [Planctomycetota bacterium]